MKINLIYLILIILFSFHNNSRAQSSIELLIDTADSLAVKDLSNYSLGQGGLSPQPMIDEHQPQLEQLHPKTIRFFIQEYFDVYPEKGVYHWEQLDKMFDAIVATGANPIPAICFKPAVLFPKVGHFYCQPTSYAEWDELIFQLVKHCKEKNYGVEYWEVGNEVDIGEDGGCPYLFEPQDYLVYYTHTTNAILRADANAKIGGPALAGFQSPIGDSLIAYCGRGKAPLDFFSWHGYTNDPGFFGRSTKIVRDKLSKYPSLKNTKTMITEWNFDLWQPNLNPYFQPAFILEATKAFQDAGLDIAAYYHIRDFFVDPNEFRPFFSEKGTDFMAHWWNVMPQYSGIYDNQGRVRPSYFVFRWLSLLKGKQLKVAGTNENIKSFATQDGERMNILVWNFPIDENAGKYDASIILSSTQKGSFRIVRLNPESAVNNIEVLRSGSVNELQKNPMNITLKPYEINWIEVWQ